jgi:hypothetical protein
MVKRVRLALAGLIAPDRAMFESVRWEGLFTVQKWDAAELAADPRATPYEVLTGHNLLVTAGANAYHQRLIGTSVNAFSSANARLGVGDATTAPAIAQTDLLAPTNKLRKIVDATPTISGNQISFVATFLTTDANFAWNEAAIFNASAAGDMLNRVQQAFGTKTSSLQWVLTGAIALS